MRRVCWIPLQLSVILGLELSCAKVYRTADHANAIVRTREEVGLGQDTRSPESTAVTAISNRRVSKGKNEE